MDDPGTFYRYAKKFSDTRSDIVPLIDDKGDFTADPAKVAELLKTQYESVFSSHVTEFVTSSTINPQGACGIGGWGGIWPPSVLLKIEM